jgi:molybdopterin-guanine dinucleotide biosynthesis protein A
MLGVVLAGGESRRMGRDKAGIVLEGQPLWRRQSEVLRSAGADPVFLVRRPGQSSPEGISCLRDVFPGAGPMAGLHAALVEARAGHVAVLAVDMPAIDPEWFLWLAGLCGPGVGAMAVHAEACEPLGAIYPFEALGETVARLERGEFSLQGLARSLEAAGLMRLVPLAEGAEQRVASLNWPVQLG